MLDTIDPTTTTERFIDRRNYVSDVGLPGRERRRIHEYPTRWTSSPSAKRTGRRDRRV